MQAHYKSYICTQCNQEIQSSETLRSHMYRCHQIQRMFMCRCCNWAFPDKTSLHIHMQSMQKSGKPGDVSVLARSSLDNKELAAAAAAAGDRHPHHHADRDHSFGSPSDSSPDEELQHFRGDSISPSPSEMEEQQQQHNGSGSGGGGVVASKLSMVKTEEDSNSSGIGGSNSSLLQQQQQQRLNAIGGIFPFSNSQQQFERTPVSQADFLLAKLGLKAEQDERGGVTSLPPHLPQPPLPLGTTFQQQWLAQLLANNPYYSQAATADPRVATNFGTTVAHPQQQHPQLQQQQGPSQNVRLIQSICSALAAASRTPGSTASQQQPAITPTIAHQTIQPPPQKKSRRGDKKHRGGAADKNSSMSQQLAEDLRLQIPSHQPAAVDTSPFAPGLSPAMSEGCSKKLNSLITNLLSIKGGGQNSPASEEGGKASPTDAGQERKNKRKLRTPTRASEMTEIVYGDELEEADEQTTLGQASAENIFPRIKRLMEEPNENGHEQPDGAADQQPSPAVSDSQTSGSSSHHGGHHLMLDQGLTSPKKCCHSCHELKARLDNAETVAGRKPVECGSKQLRENVEQVRHLAERVASLAAAVPEAETKEELMLCARQLQAIAEGH